MKNKGFLERVEFTTELSMEISSLIIEMKHGQSENYDKALALLSDLRRSQMELINENYELKRELEDKKVEIPDFIVR